MFDHLLAENTYRNPQGFLLTRDYSMSYSWYFNEDGTVTQYLKYYHYMDTNGQYVPTEVICYE